jgi:branched-chain amino acid transport system ATP-binding protein
MTTPLLNVRHLTSGYGHVKALEDISFDIQSGEIFSVVGANGAGKSTLLLTIAGHLQPFSGTVEFAGQDCTAISASQAPAHGLVMVPEGGRLFPFMTVLENLELGAYHRTARACMKQTLDEVLSLFPVLAERQHQLAGRLSGGERQMCAVGRALMSLPRLLMLDEPSLGLAPIMVDRLFDKVQSLVHQKGLTVLLVEQNVGNALRLCQRGCVLDHGRLVKVSTGAELLRDPEVQRAYMGV